MKAPYHAKKDRFQQVVFRVMSHRCRKVCHVSLIQRFYGNHFCRQNGTGFPPFSLMHRRLRDIRAQICTTHLACFYTLLQFNWANFSGSAGRRLPQLCGYVCDRWVQGVVPNPPPPPPPPPEGRQCWQLAPRVTSSGS